MLSAPKELSWVLDLHTPLHWSQEPRGSLVPVDFAPAITLREGLIRTIADFKKRLEARGAGDRGLGYYVT